MASEPLQILLIDDDEDDFFLARDVLTETMTQPFTVRWTASYDSGLDEIRQGEVDVVLLDYRLGKKTGLDFLLEPEVRECPAPIILLTGQGERKVDLEAMQAGAADYLTKEHLQDTLERTIRHTLERSRDRRALQRLNEELEQRVTERTWALERANSRLKEADRRKDEFIAILAHELRNPLAPIANALSIMREQDTDLELCREARQTVERQLAHMVRLVDDLLEVGRVSQGKIELRKSSFVLGDILQQAIETARPSVEQRNQQFVYKPADEPITLFADPTRVMQIVGNLLNNASKFTPPGGRIELAVKRSGDQAVVSVKDNGVGMEPQQVPRIFELFTQLDSSLERTQGGLGIGLTLVKNLVRMHGGSIEARSEGLNRGSEFLVTLPVQSAAAATPPSPVAPPKDSSAPRRRILIVDDNRDAANTLSLLLRISKHEVQTVYDGVSAVESVGQFQPDLVLMDIGLPGMNGLDAAKLIRSGPHGPGLTLVAMTGWGQDEDRQRSREAGFDHHLVKPVDRAALAKLLAEFPSRT